MKNFIKSLLAKNSALVSLMCLITFGSQSQTTITMSTAACTIGSDSIGMDIMVTNTSPVSTLRFNSTVIRMTVPAAMIPAGAQTYTFNYWGGSDFPLGFPAAGNPSAGASFNAASRLLTWTTGSAGVYNNTSCPASSAVPILPGETKKIGRFSFKITSSTFVPGADATFTWSTTTSCNLYIDCTPTVTAFNQASGFRTLDAPCVLTVPVACTSPTVDTNPLDKVVCYSALSTSFSGSFTGGTPAPTLMWQVQEGGVGLFTDIGPSTPYYNYYNASSVTTNTLILTRSFPPSGNRYRLKASNSCGDVFTTDALLTVIQPVSAGPLSGPASLCTGAESLFTNAGTPGGTWSSTNPSVASVSASGVVTALSSGSTNIEYTLFNCGSPIPIHASSSLNVTGNALLAGVAAGPIICSNAAVQSAATEPAGTSFSDGSCNSIAKILPSGLAQVSGNINTCVTIDDIVRTYHNFPYVQRHYDIVPAVNAANATATLTLYYTQADFDAYNLVRGINPSLPVSGADVENYKANLLITQYHGTGVLPGDYDSGTVDLINPADNNIVYNSSLNRWEVTFDVNGFSGFFLHTSPTNSPLPVSLLSFGGRNNGNNNLLEWATSTEQNSSHFELLRSTDGINFVKVSSITAAGTSNTIKKYSYSDDISQQNARIFYYRLKQVDIMGQTRLSAIVKIRLSSGGFNVEASPNPFADQLRVQVEANQKENATIYINGISGKRILSQSVSLNKGSNVLNLDKLAHLASGVYMLTVITDTQKTTIKVIKQ